MGFWAFRARAYKLNTKPGGSGYEVMWLYYTGLRVFVYCTAIIKNRTEKTMEHGMQTALIQEFIVGLKV